MPAHASSLRITDTYRDRLLTLRTRAGVLAAANWRRTVNGDDLDGTHPQWVAETAAQLAVIQAASVRLTAAYLTAFLGSELGAPAQLVRLDENRYIGQSRTGKTLPDALVPTVITVKNDIAAGKPRADAMRSGMLQADRLAVSETMDAARHALGDGIRDDHRIRGWRRVTSGGCGACLAAATRTYSDHEPLRVHDHCRCHAEPVVRDVHETVHRPDGRQTFQNMTAEQQNTLLGPDKAELIRSGAVDFADLIAVSPMVAISDQITEAPLETLQALAA